MDLSFITYPAIDPVAFAIGPIQVRWYGLAYLTAFVASFFIARWLARRWKLGLTDDDLLTIILGAVIGVVIGGRLGYVLFYGGAGYLRSPGQVLAIWTGGMSFHGGLAGIVIAGLIVSRMLRMPAMTLMDVGAACAPVGLLLGRVANFINNELWGRVTAVPWAVTFPGAGNLPRHPSQLYEAALEGVVIFAVMMWFATRRPAPFRGVMLGWLLVMYGVFRAFVELFREPDIQIGLLPGGVTMGQMLSLPVLIAGALVLVWAYKRRLPQAGRSGG
ncbi:MAG: prolipoprotein diacylglyceryl transferase [Coriobacteriia bacterium]|nr:prolipoprotein diacylglyceryl transferase [Coriobacteriia bacterium]